MQITTRWSVLGRMLLIVVFTAFCLENSYGGVATQTLLYKFSGGLDGAYPSGGLVFDASGNLYGATRFGGTFDSGIIFELTPNGSGGWQKTTLYNFTGGTDGSQPNCLIFDHAGNLYGTTLFGGTIGYGVAFELTPDGAGGWQEQVLHTFGLPNDGELPEGVVFDSSGNLFGTTEAGGAHALGTVFVLQPFGGTWTEQILYSFAGGSDDGSPAAGLAIDAKGNLYGTTSGEGTGGGLGTVFQMTNTASGWVKNILHSFLGPEGYQPISVPLLDSYGNVYVTALTGGPYSAGTVYELKPSSSGWQGSMIFAFTGQAMGEGPAAGVVMDTHGNLFGTNNTASTSGGSSGTVFRLSRAVGGSWNLSMLFRFSGTNGGSPGAVILDSQGNVYGTTSSGGTHHYGVVYELVP